jgi:hypothetical protein
MGHSIQVILGPRAAVEALAENWVYAKAFALPQGFAAMPLTDELSDDIMELLRKNGKVKPFVWFSEAHQEVLEQASSRTQLAYLETDYFGGLGMQCAVLFEKGKLTLGPLKTETLWDEQLQQYRSVPEGERAINAVLQAMGVWKGKMLDEFDALELGKYRNNEVFFR